MFIDRMYAVVLNKRQFLINRQIVNLSLSTSVNEVMK